MDISRLRTGEWMTGIGGILLFVSLFLPWYGFSAGAGAVVVGDSWSAWTALGGIDWLLFIIAAIAIVTTVLTALGRSISLPITLSAITAALGIVALALIVFRIIDNPAPGVASDFISMRWGIFVALVAAAVLTVGSWLVMQSEGVTFKQAGSQLGQQVGQWTDQARQPGQQPPPQHGYYDPSQAAHGQQPQYQQPPYEQAPPHPHPEPPGPGHYVPPPDEQAPPHGGQAHGQAPPPHGSPPGHGEDHPEHR